MFRVVILHPVVDPQERRAPVRDRVYTNVVALECLYECLGHAVALGAFDRRGSILVAIDDGIGDHALGDNADNITHARTGAALKNDRSTGAVAL